MLGQLRSVNTSLAKMEEAEEMQQQRD